MEISDKIKIYSLLRKTFACNTPYLMAQIGTYLNENQIKCTDYGFEKIRPFLEEMPECVSIAPVQTANGGFNYTVTVLVWEVESDFTPSDEKYNHAITQAPYIPTQNVPVSECRTLSEADKRAIYALLTEEYPTESPLPMASISLTMTNEGYRKETFGFSKMKMLLMQLSQFMTLQDTVTNGVPATLITLHRVPAWDAAPMEEPDAVSDAFQNLPNTMDNIMLPNKTLAILNQLITGEEALPSSEVIEQLKASYSLAKIKGTFITKDNSSYTFPLSLKTNAGDSMMAGIKPSTFGDTKGWYLNFVGTKHPHTFHNAPGKALEKFAFMGFWDNVLNDLADMALPEKWYFKGEDPNSKLMLRGYLQYTFYRLQLEDKVCVSDDEQFAAFNTGLVTPRYDDIFACFEPNPDPRKSKWRFIGFSKSGGRGIGKRIVNYFNPLPQPASYFERKEDLLFDLERDLHPDYDHILLDNISRLPIGFLREELHNEKDVLEILNEIEATQSGMGKKKLYIELRECVENSDKIYNRLRNRVEDAIDMARKQVRWNFKTALPCFFPTRNVMSLMLPLCLVEDGHADVALVVEPTRAGNYQGQTILTLQQAYIDSRLICRPNSEWLNTDDILLDSEAYAETEQ